MLLNLALFVTDSVLAHAFSAMTMVLTCRVLATVYSYIDVAAECGFAFQ